MLHPKDLLSGGHLPSVVVGVLNDLFTRFDQIAEHCGLEKIKFLYALWGDVLNTASRMESHGTTGRTPFPNLGQ